MKVAIVSSCLTRNAGGILDSLRGLTAELSGADGVVVEVLGLEEPGMEQPTWQGVRPVAFPVTGPGQFGYSPALAKALRAGEFEVVHQHALWMYPSVAVPAWHRATGRPYVVSPHGMLDAWALANSGWKKRIASALFERRNLEGAACLHALCEAEAKAMRAYGLRNPIAVIPNGVVLPEAKPSSVQCSVFSVQPEEEAKKKALLFLGRLHPKKGLPGALRGWAEATQGKEAGWRLVIAGDRKSVV
jgi:poly(glycerol-phosphate) alpha-glucosyltransferase